MFQVFKEYNTMVLLSGNPEPLYRGQISSFINVVLAELMQLSDRLEFHNKNTHIYDLGLDNLICHFIGK